MVENFVLANGLTVIVEEMPHVESVSYSLAIPGGLLSDASGCVGSSLLLAELTSRGAGDLDSRQLSAAFEQVGARHGEGVGLERFSFSGSLLGEDLEEALRLVALQVQAPLLPESEIENIKSLFLQDIQALLENPARRVGREFTLRFFPEPFNRPSSGDAEGIVATQLTSLTEQWKKTFVPEGAVLSIAGKCRANDVRGAVERQFGAWSGERWRRPEFKALKMFGSEHLDHEGAQVQILMSAPSANVFDPVYYPAKVALSVLSGGMFGRLFIEVRERRGLVYTVSAGHSANSDYGFIKAYAGTTPERAEETIRVMRQELNGLFRTVSEQELSRAKANIKASLIIGQETAAARASSNASDWWLFKKVRTLEEIEQEIDRVEVADIDRFVDSYPMNELSILTLGPKIGAV